MTAGWAVVDGTEGPPETAVFPVTDPAVSVGWSVFETLRSDRQGQVHRLDEHLERLRTSCEAACVPTPPLDRVAEECQRAAAGVVGHARIRVTVSGSGRRVVLAEPLDPARMHTGVRAVRGAWRSEPFLGGGVKHGSRAPWVVAVRRSGVDEVLLVDPAGRFTEGTTCAILAVMDGALWTAPHDGRILESRTCVEICERAEALGIPIVWEGPPADGGWQGLYIASTTRDLAPVLELDGEALGGWEPIGRRLIAGVRERFEA